MWVPIGLSRRQQSHGGREPLILQRPPAAGRRRRLRQTYTASSGCSKKITDVPAVLGIYRRSAPCRRPLHCRPRTLVVHRVWTTGTVGTAGTAGIDGIDGIDGIRHPGTAGTAGTAGICGPRWLHISVEAYECDARHERMYFVCTS